MPDIEFVRAEIERMRVQVQRQRREIMQLQRAGISTTSAEALLDRMLNKVDDLCAERDRLKKEREMMNALPMEEEPICDAVPGTAVRGTGAAIGTLAAHGQEKLSVIKAPGQAHNLKVASSNLAPATKIDRRSPAISRGLLGSMRVLLPSTMPIAWQMRAAPPQRAEQKGRFEQRLTPFEAALQSSGEKSRPGGTRSYCKAA